MSKAPKQAAETLARRFQGMLTAIHRKLAGDTSLGAQPAMSFFCIIRLLDPQQHASLNTDFNLLMLPHVANADLQTAQEWQTLLNQCNDPGAAINTDVISLGRSVVPCLHKPAPAALASLAVLSTNVDVECSFSIYKTILTDNCQSMKMEKMKNLFISKSNAESGGLQSEVRFKMSSLNVI